VESTFSTRRRELLPISEPGMIQASTFRQLPIGSDGMKNASLQVFASSGNLKRLAFTTIFHIMKYCPCAPSSAPAGSRLISVGANNVLLNGQPLRDMA